MTRDRRLNDPCLDSCLFPRSGEVTPLQVAKNIVAALEDAEKSSPQFRAIVQWDQDEILKVRSFPWEKCRLFTGKGSHRHSL